MSSAIHPAIAEGSVAVVTGGASGIGLATAERLARAGLRVCIADHDEEALSAAVDALADAGCRSAAAASPRRNGIEKTGRGQALTRKFAIRLIGSRVMSRKASGASTFSMARSQQAIHWSRWSSPMGYGWCGSVRQIVPYLSL